MANMTHYEIIRNGVATWNRWRKGNPDVRPDLSGANLCELDLAEADLTEANLYRARLHGSSLLWADLTWTNLTQTDLCGADLQWANLRGANFSGTQLQGTNFAQAPLACTNFANVDLSEAEGLLKVQHHYPSTVGIDTLFRSHGQIPLDFLRGCGVPDDFLEYFGQIAHREL